MGVWQIGKALAEVALRRRGPESLPDSTFLLLLLLIVYLAVSSLSLMLDGGLMGHDLLLLAGDTSLALAFIFAVLSFFKLERRFRQTVIAILGAEVFINLVYLPCAIVALGFGMELTVPPFALIWLVFLIWSVVIGAWVLARSLSQPLIVGFMFEILYLFVSYSLVDLLTVNPDPTNAAGS